MARMRARIAFTAAVRTLVCGGAGAGAGVIGAWYRCELLAATGGEGVERAASGAKVPAPAEGAVMATGGDTELAELGSDASMDALACSVIAFAWTRVGKREALEAVPPCTSE